MSKLSINGVDFQVIKPRDMITMNEKWYDEFFKDSKSLQDCYTKPSSSKQFIFNKWFNWWSECCTTGLIQDRHWLGVTSFNCRMFTIGAVFEYNNIRYIMHVTKSSNKLYQCSV